VAIIRPFLFIARTFIARPAAFMFRRTGMFRLTPNGVDHNALEPIDFDQHEVSECKGEHSKSLQVVLCTVESSASDATFRKR